jgi:hypothetical protein
LTGEDFNVVLSKGAVCASLRRERLAHNRVLDSLLLGTCGTVDLDQLARFALAYWNAAELRLDDQIIVRVVIIRELELIEELVRKTVGRQLRRNGKRVHIHNQHELGGIVRIDECEYVRDVSFRIGVSGGRITMIRGLDVYPRARSIE